MYYSININQIAIANHNQNFGTNLDIIDGVILLLDFLFLIIQVNLNSKAGSIAVLSALNGN